MKKLVISLTTMVLGTAIAGAGGLEVKPLGKPFRVREVGAPAAPSPRQSPARLERIWEVREGPTIDVVTGQIVEPGAGSRSSTVIYDNTVNPTPYYGAWETTTIVGDNLGMVNGGTVTQLTMSVFNGDSANKLTKAKIKVVYIDGRYPSPTVLRTIVMPEKFDFTAYYPGGMGQGQGLFIGLDLSALEPPLVLPAYVYLGQELLDIEGNPAPPTTIGPAVYNPPTVGVSKCQFWNWTLDGTGVYTGNWFFGCTPPPNFYWRIEVDPLQWTPPPIYDNTVNSLNYASNYPVGAIFADDLIMANTPPGEYLDRLDFSISNGSTAETLSSLELDIELHDWNPASSGYYCLDFSGAPDQCPTISLANVPVNLPPGYAGLFYVDHLATLNISVAQDIAAGLRFRNVQPPTIPSVGQALFDPVAKGGSEDIFWVGDYPGLTTGWYWFGGNPWAAFYWGVTTAAPRPCTESGDMNCDGAVNNQDIDGFVDALFGLTEHYDAYLHSFPVYRPCDMLCADFSGDGSVNNQDIDGFVAALFGT